MVPHDGKFEVAVRHEREFFDAPKERRSAS